ncbi:DUF7379 domain-containing protein [Falsiroseomonas sp. HC035]|uniref:DUF7379 domain-containing protein n=1 Tax=Falsiroseomonas sp. HC035 TaxID=3390999 RepID=UPI003D3174AF
MGVTTGMVQILVHGAPDPAVKAMSPVGPEAQQALADAGLQIEVEEAFRTGALRGAAISLPAEVADQDVVELELDGGARIFVRADDLAARLGLPVARGEAAAVVIPAALPIGSGERGLVDWALRSIRVLGLKPLVGVVGQHVAARLGQAVEDRQCPEPGMKYWDGATLTPIGAPLPVSEQPWLLFLHGTASSTMGSFSGLAGRETEWSQLTKVYGNRILTLEHRTLTVSPVQNAIDALQALPAGAKVHLVSHSRGGLVGELLCRGQLVGRDAAFTAEEKARFDAGTQRLLDQLGALLADRKISVDRFVRVACPARGTILASDRLDLWLNGLLNALGLLVTLVPIPAVAEAYDLLKALTIAVVKEKADASVLPGLEAMMPGLPLVQVLNRPDVVTKADLSAIRGDIEGEGFLRRLAILATDLFYQTDHDLVVNTNSMDGGMRRPDGGARSFTDRGSAVSHFAYFSNERTAALLVRGLLRERDDAAGFQALMPDQDLAMPALAAARDDARRPLVFVLPGIMGSHLTVDGERVWLDPLKMAFGGCARIGMAAEKVGPGGPIALYYGGLCRYLTASHDVVPWAYDWRLSIEATGLLFRRALEDALKRTDRPVRILAHSQGGLVARAALGDRMVGDRFHASKDNRFIMLGTPNGGSHAVPLVLLGRDRTLQTLNMLDITQNAKELLTVIARFPALLEMLPRDPAFDLFSLAAWKELQGLDPDRAGWVLPDQDDLAQARAMRDRFDAAPFAAEKVLYVAGQAPTPERLLADGAALDPLRFAMTAEGDGRVPWRSGIMAGMRSWFVPAAHGDLPRHADAFPGLVELLQRAATQLLSDRPPATPQRGTGLPPLLREIPPIQPDLAELAAAALGGTRAAAAPPPPARIKVSVVHGHVAMADYPVMVGHYIGDTISGAERAIDRLMDGRLSARQRLDFYPGPRGSAEVMLDRRHRPEGAIVMGLGVPGELTGGLLEEVYLCGFLHLDAAEEEERIARGEAERRRRALSTVLVGAGEGGVSTRDAVGALVRAAARARRALGEAGAIAELQIVELFEHRAIDIWHELQRLQSSPDAGQLQIELVPRIQSRDGGARRLASTGDPGWWQPVQVTVEGEGDRRTLNFSAPSGRARVEALSLAYNERVIDLFAEQVAGSSGAAPQFGTPGRALFELLWPDSLKERSQEDRNLRLILDAETASFPWEMLDDRRPWQVQPGSEAEGGRMPPAVRAGAIRQLIRRRFRDRPRAAALSYRRALVVGDPTAVPTKGFPPLPGAREEAEVVARLLAVHGYQVTLVTGQDASPARILALLYEDAWSIVHIAAHGVVRHRFSPDGPEETGIVLGGPFVLSPALLDQMPVPPQLAFVNCCHVGAIDRAAEVFRARGGSLPQLAATVSVQLIEMGARAVVAAGWAVDDAAAKTFADTFYRGLLDGGTFGDTVKAARQRIYRDYGYTTTWGAYQCYGEPDWQLHKGISKAEAPVLRDFASPAEVLQALDEIRGAAATGTERDLGKLLDRLKQVRVGAQRKGADFTGHAEVAAKLGQTFADLGELEPALGWYNKAMEAERADMPVRVIEQRANLRARLAIRRVRDADWAAEAVKQAQKDIATSVKELKSLVGIGHPTAERHALLGSCHKRLAQLRTGAERLAALRDMQKAYAEAAKPPEPKPADPKPTDPKPVEPYHLSMQAAAIILLVRLGDPKATLEPAMQLIAQVVAMAAPRYAQSGDFFDGIAEADAAVLRALATGEGFDKALDLYLRPWRRNGSRLMFASALDQLDFLADVLRGAFEMEGQVAARDGLRQMIEALEELARAVRERGEDRA